MMHTDVYRGNINLKRANVPVEWTPELIREWKRCKDDPIYFAQNYIKIVHVDHGLIPIDLYDYQKEIIEKSLRSRRVCVVTSRQAGKTTTAAILLLHYVLFNPYKTVALLANKADSSREILERIQIAFEALPNWLQQGVVEWNKGNVLLENGSKIIACSTSSSAIRGKSVSYLYIDETAFVEGWDDFFASVFPTVTSGETTKILFTSTPNGLNHFFRTVEGARKKTNGYELVEVPWQRVPGRGEAWRRETIQGLDFDEQKFEQEYNLAFLGSSGTLISGWKLKIMQEDMREPLKQTPDGLMVYEEKKSNDLYALIADTSRGKGLDYSAFSVINISGLPYKQVAVFRNNQITPIEYAQYIYETAKHYNNAPVLLELNDLGQQVSDTLFLEYEYESVLSTENAGRSGKKISFKSGKGIDRGIYTSKTVKSTGCSLLKLLVEQNQLVINDHMTIYEFSRFSKKANTYQAETGAHDDIVMGLVLFAWLTEQQYFKDLTDINTLQHLRDFTEQQISEKMLPVGFNTFSENNDKDEKIVVIAEDGNDNWLDGDWDINQFYNSREYY